MSFLAPWALVIGVASAAGLVLLHLVSRQRPAAYLLPTARFIPDQRTLVRRLATRPRDRVLLALRVLIVLSAAAAFARPVLAPARAPRARIVLLDRSGAVADPAAALARLRALADDGIPTRLVLFDSAAVLASDAMVALDSLVRDAGSSSRGDSLARVAPRATQTGSITAALVAARRAAPALARAADVVELVLVSPVAAREIDAATDAVRARWPGALRIERIAAHVDSDAGGTIARAIGVDDPLGPAMAGAPIAATARSVRLTHSPPRGVDSAVARAGGALVWWDEVAQSPLRPSALVMGDDVVIAPLRRGPPDVAGVAGAPGWRTIARWTDGSPAAIEMALRTRNRENPIRGSVA